MIAILPSIILRSGILMRIILMSNILLSNILLSALLLSGILLSGILFSGILLSGIFLNNNPDKFLISFFNFLQNSKSCNKTLECLWLPLFCPHKLKMSHFQFSPVIQQIHLWQF